MNYLRLSKRSRPSSSRLSGKVPSPERVPSEPSLSMRGSVQSSVREQLTSLSDMMISLTLRHEQQRRQLEELQQTELEKYEQLFTAKQRQVLQFLSGKETI